jgi:3-oxoacyl-[acyl-carrier protein] reductase
MSRPTGTRLLPYWPLDALVQTRRMSQPSRAVLVTGGSRGIGAAVAREFAAAGDRVAVHYASARQAAEQTLESLAGDGHVMAVADLRDPAAVLAMVDGAASALGGIDVLVNNAGIFVAHPITTVTYEQWQQAWQDTLGVNLVGAANVTWCALRHMPTGGGGRIVNVSSRGAFRGEPGQPAYGASKAGLVAFGQSLAQDLGSRGISVTTVAPGFTDTDMAAEVLAGPDGDRRRAESPMGRVATPEEVAQAVFYLASPQAEFATGTVLDMNGASFLRM